MQKLSIVLISLFFLSTIAMAVPSSICAPYGNGDARVIGDADGDGDHDLDDAEIIFDTPYFGTSREEYSSTDWQNLCCYNADKDNYIDISDLVLISQHLNQDFGTCSPVTGKVDFHLSDNTISVKKGETTTIDAVIKNELGETENFSIIETRSSSKFQVEITEPYPKINVDETKIIRIEITGTSSGTGESEISLLYGPNMEKETLFVTVEEEEEYFLELRNIGNRTIEENSGKKTRWINLHTFTTYSGNKDELTYTRKSNTNWDLINCYIADEHYISCDEPARDKTGYAEITIEVKNPQNIKDTDSFTITVEPEDNEGNGSCSDLKLESRSFNIDEDGEERIFIEIRNQSNDDFDVERVRVYENDSEISVSVIDEPNLIREDSYDNIELELMAFNVSGDKRAEFTVEVEGKFEHGKSCGFGDIEREYNVYIDEDSSGSGICGEIEIDLRDVYMDESETREVIFRIENNGPDDFIVDDVDLSENSSDLGINNIDWDTFIDEDEAGDLSFTLRTGSISRDEIVNVGVKVRGHYRYRGSCSTREVGVESFDVHIDNGGSSGGICSDIEIDIPDYRISEGTTTTKTIRIKNDNSRDFKLERATIIDNSAYFDIDLRGIPSRIDGNDEEEIDLRITTENVSSDKRGKATLRLSGEFSNGRECSISNLSEDFYITVDDGFGNGDDLSGLVEIDFSESFISIREGETRNVRATITNELDGSQCFELSTIDDSVFDSSISDSSVCLSSGEEEETDIRITGIRDGRGNLQLKASYDGKSKSKFITVDVEGREIERPRVSAAIPDEIEQGDNLELINSGSTLINVSIRLVSEDAGFEILTLNVWREGEKIEFPIETEFTGTLKGDLIIESDSGSATIPVEFDVTEPQTGPTGLIGLAGTAGLALILLVLVILAVIGIISVLSKK